MKNKIYEIGIKEKTFLVKILNDYYDIKSFEQAYYLILTEFFTKFKEGKIGNFFEYIKTKLNDPYLNNLLQEEEFEFNENNNVLTDSQGSYKIIFQIIEDNNIYYLNNSYIWIQLANGKKYFYYTD